MQRRIDEFLLSKVSENNEFIYFIPPGTDEFMDARHQNDEGRLNLWIPINAFQDGVKREDFMNAFFVDGMVKEKENATEYHITVMNGDLEKLLYGNHIITEVDGQVQIDSPIENNEQLYLKFQIEEALSRHLRASHQ